MFQSQKFNFEISGVAILQLQATVAAFLKTRIHLFVVYQFVGAFYHEVKGSLLISSYLRIAKMHLIVFIP